LAKELGPWLKAGKPAIHRAHGPGLRPPTCPEGTPRWIKPDPRYIDRDVDRNNDRFIRHWGNPPFLMTPEERSAAGVTEW
jgi:hypothetical protein